MRCVDTVARYLFYTFIIDFSLEMLDLIHRIYESDESFRSLDFMVHTRLYLSQVIVQIFLGTLTPIVLLALTQLFRLSETMRKRIYGLAGSLTMIGILAMRWNVVIGGQLFSKSLRGVMSYKMEFAGHEGWLLSMAVMCLPVIILTTLVKFFLAVNLPTSEDVVPGAIPTKTAEQS